MVERGRARGLLGVVLAAGEGTRLGYLGPLMPKTMVPVAGRPLLWYALRALGQMGARDVVVATLVSHATVLAYLRSLDVRALHLRSVRPHALPALTRSPVETLLSAAGGTHRELAVIAGDTMMEARNLRGYVQTFRRRRADVGVLVVREKDRAALQGACEVRVDRAMRVAEIREKPKRPRWGQRACATLLFRPDVVPQLVAEAGTWTSRPGLTDLVAAGARRGRALGYPLHGWEVNVNTVHDLIDCWKRHDPKLRGAL